MTTQNAPARITAVVIIVVALLAASVSSVAVTLWVLLMAVPVLVTLRLALNLLDGAAQDNPARVARIMALAIIGLALVAAGVASVMTLWTSSFARFMYLEDLGLDGTTADTAVDRGLLIIGGILALLGAALIAAAVLARYRARAGR